MMINPARCTCMTEHEIIQKYATAFNNRDHASLVELFADEVKIPIHGIAAKETVSAWIKSILISSGTNGTLHTGNLARRPAMYTQFPGLHGSTERQGYGTIKINTTGQITELEWADDPVTALSIT